jgi:very-short-patch-repair endonuclease
MGKTLISLGVLAIIVVAVLAFMGPVKKRKQLFAAKAKIPLTKNEQPMYFRLVEAFPELIVLAQVSFSALLTSNDRASRNKFDRKTADFVLCTKSFAVVAVIELDDASHNGKAKEDAERDALLSSVGHSVVRFKKVPDVAAIRSVLPKPAAIVTTT